MSLTHSISTGLLLGSYRGQSQRSSSSRSSTHEERLRQAASQGDVKTVVQMLNAGADGDAPDAYGVTSLMHACIASSLQIVTELIEYSVHVNAKDKYGQTALHFACAYGHVEIVKYLLDHKANVHAVTVAGQTPLMKAVYNTTSLHASDVIDLLLKYKAKVNAQADDGRTALHIAIEHDNISAVRTLLAYPGIDMNATTKDGRTPIHISASTGSSVLMETLVIAGVDTELKTKKGETIYDIQPHNETMKMAPGALKQLREEIVKKGKQQAAEEKKRTIMNAELEQKSKINMSKHTYKTYEEEQAELEAMTASRRNQFYKNMGNIQQQKVGTGNDAQFFHHDYTKPGAIDLQAKPAPEKDIPMEAVIEKEIIPTSIKQATNTPNKPIIPHTVPILEQKSQHLDITDITRVPAPSEHVHHTVGTKYVHTAPITTLTSTPAAAASPGQAYSIKIGHNASPAPTTTATAPTAAPAPSSEKKVYTINLGGKK